MARIVETKVVAETKGVAITKPVANALGHEFENDGQTKLLVVNDGGVPVVVTVLTPATLGPEALAVASLTVTVVAGASKLIGPFGVDVYGGTVQFDFDVTASVSFFLFR